MTKLKNQLSFIVNISSIGPIEIYKEVIFRIIRNKNHWRKVANMMNQIHRQMKPWPHIDRDGQHASAQQTLIQSLKDTKLPLEIKEEIKKASAIEFQFKFT